MILIQLINNAANQWIHNAKKSQILTPQIDSTLRWKYRERRRSRRVSIVNTLFRLICNKIKLNFDFKYTFSDWFATKLNKNSIINTIFRLICPQRNLVSCQMTRKSIITKVKFELIYCLSGSHFVSNYAYKEKHSYLCKCVMKDW